MLLCAALFFAACSGGSNATPTPSPSTGSDEAATRDLIDLAHRLRGVDVPRQVDQPAPSVGDQLTFALIDLPPGADAQPGYHTVTFTVRAISDHAYFLIADAANVPDAEVLDASRVFEDKIWPAVTGAFGPPPIPGVDGDPRIYILHGDLGEGLGGYVSAEDAFPRAASVHSNGREALYINASIRPLGSDSYARVVAHEFQHLIHQRLDQGEDTWVNEGLSQYAAALLGHQESDYKAFLDKPDTQLNAWSSLDSSAAHYDAASLFVTYLIEQTGGTGGELAAEPGDGVEGVRQYLLDHHADRSFEQLVGDWAVANVLDESQGPYGYRDRQVKDAATTVLKPGTGTGEVHQFATDYLEVDASDFTSPAFDFQGDSQVPALAAESTANGAFWWSGLGDSMDATLTRELDLSKVDTATLTFRAWFDIERWFDYGFVEVSTDGGNSWKALAGQQTSTQDPLGVAYGPGYTGKSGAGDKASWVNESIDLTPYAGSKVLLRFEYLTDDSNHNDGLAIDDIAVPEIGFVDDALSDPGGWIRAGFRRVSAPLAQRFELRLVTMGPTPAVQSIALDANNHARIDLTGLGTDYQRAIIAVVGATDGTEQQTAYRYELTPGGGSPEGGIP